MVKITFMFKEVLIYQIELINTSFTDFSILEALKQKSRLFLVAYLCSENNIISLLYFVFCPATLILVYQRG